MKTFLAAVVFYTKIPLPKNWTLEFQRIARWSPLVGLLIGGLLGLIDISLGQFGFPILTRSALIVALWIVLTGGLHLDGAIDTADGLAVLEPQRRLQVMQDSTVGAFGVIAAAVILGLKITALSDLLSYRWLGLMLAAGWGRWGQVVAIAFYPYLKPSGKGAFHKQFIRLPQDILGGFLILLGLNGLWWRVIAIPIAGCAIALLTGFWFYRRLGGQTGDTYGAIVEWTEALFLCLLTAIV
ncbi:MAG: adenosylcobinamide-GDP ribazoletransferase [Microcystaceae cyanobacterium]